MRVPPWSVRRQRQAVWAALALQKAERQLPDLAVRVALGFLQNLVAQPGPSFDLYRWVPRVLHSLAQEASEASVSVAWEAAW
jgi:hypothetical protein